MTVSASTWHHLLLALLMTTGVQAADGHPVTYTLDIATTTLTPAGTPREALTINGGIPGLCPVTKWNRLSCV